VSDSVVTDLDENIGSIEHLLAHRGRSSTPPPPGRAKLNLAEMLRIDFHSESPFHSRLKVATIVHDEFYDELEKFYSVLPLLPSCLVNSVDAGQPRLIVIHRAAFQDGPWYGAEDAAGGIAVDVIMQLLPWSRKHKVPVLFVENGAPDSFYTGVLREIGTEHFPSDQSYSRVTEGAPRSTIFQLAHKFARQQPAMRNGEN